MTSCTQLDDLLLQGDPISLETAAQHAASCPACAEVLAAWNDLSATARSMHTTWTNDLLWPRIEHSIRKRKRPRALWQIAAAFLLAALLGGGAWLGMRQHERQQFDAHILRINALDEVERAEQAHLAAIDHLARVAQPRIDQSQTPLMISYREKLMVLDDAIAQCQTAIDHNRQNAHIRQQLQAIYSEKQRTLQDVLREENHVSNP
jgi:hypothetical protein